MAGASYQLELTEPALDNAIHGLTRWLTWQLAGHTADSVGADLAATRPAGYPFRLDLSAHYRLTAADGLEVTVTARNTGSCAAPFGTGSHPYLRVGSDLADNWELQLPAARWQPADARGIPDGPPQDVSGSPYDFRERRPIGGTTLDHAFTGLVTGPDGRAVARLVRPGRGSGPVGRTGYRWLQVFTGDPLGPDARRRAVAIEPMTCPPNAFVTGTTWTLEPGDSRRRTAGVSRPLVRPGTWPSRLAAAAEPAQVVGCVDIVRAAGVAALHRRHQAGVRAQERRARRRRPPPARRRSAQCSRPIRTGLRGLPS